MPAYERCLNCKWRSEEETMICMCEESDHLSDYVDRNDTCDHWEFIGNE